MSKPEKGIAYEFEWPLVDIDDPVFNKVNPTIVAGDFRVSIDGNPYSNMATIPVVNPAGSRTVKFNLSALEMGGDKVTIEGHDISEDEWGDFFAFLDLDNGTIQTIVDLLDGDFEVTKFRSITRKKGTAIILRDKDVSGSRLSVNDTIRTTEHL